MTASEKRWLKVAPCSSISPREGRCVEVAGRQVALFHTSEGFLAVDNRCPHPGGPLADGIVNGTAVVCPLHAWKFDLLSGIGTNHPESPVSLITYPTRTEDGILYIELPPAIAPDEIRMPACEHRDRPIHWVRRKESPPSSTG
jgi:nitrite reductase (NADH) small subunit